MKSVSLSHNSVFVMAMAKKTVENGQIRTAKQPHTVKIFGNKKGATSPINGVTTPPRQSPTGGVSPPRTSPGLLAGHYAGCKFSEPPLPSALPLPPQHWTQAPHSAVMSFHRAKSEQLDIAQQLKVLLKVQA